MNKNKRVPDVEKGNVGSASNVELAQKIDELHQDLEKLNRTMERVVEIEGRQYRWRYIIPISMMRGLITAIGATIVFAILIYFAGQLIEELETFPLLNNLLEKVPWEEIVNNSKESSSQ